MVIAVVLLKLTHHTGLLEMPKIVTETAKALAPLIAINVLGLGVNTLCLVYVDTSFYQVLISLSSPFATFTFIALLFAPFPSFYISNPSMDNNNYLAGHTTDKNSYFTLSPLGPFVHLCLLAVPRRPFQLENQMKRCGAAAHTTPIILAFAHTFSFLSRGRLLSTFPSGLLDCTRVGSSIHSPLCLCPPPPTFLKAGPRRLLHCLLWLLHRCHLRDQRLQPRHLLRCHLLHHHLPPRDRHQKVPPRCQQLDPQSCLLQQCPFTGCCYAHDCF